MMNKVKPNKYNFYYYLGNNLLVENHILSNFRFDFFVSACKCVQPVIFFFQVIIQYVERRELWSSTSLLALHYERDV